MNQLVGKDMLMQMVMECVTIEGLLIAKQPIVATMADIPDNEYSRKGMMCARVTTLRER